MNVSIWKQLNEEDIPCVKHTHDRCPMDEERKTEKFQAIKFKRFYNIVVILLI